MTLSRKIWRAFSFGSLAVTVALALATSASADTINLTRFSSTVSGTGAPANATVTVNLLRNAFDASTGAVVRNRVDTFTTSADGTGAWRGSFIQGHAFSSHWDEVEVSYNGAAPETIGASGGPVLPGVSIIDVPADMIDAFGGNIAISQDGTTIFCNLSPCTTGGEGWLATELVGGSPVQTNGGALSTSPTLTLSPAATLTTPVTVTVQTVQGGTTVDLTDNAPLPAPVVLPTYTPSTANSSLDEPQPWCTAYIAQSEVVCQNLVPGSYTLSANGNSQTLTVPAPPSPNLSYSGSYNNTAWPSVAGAMFPSLSAGERVTLSTGTRVLTTLTVQEPTVQASQPLGDLYNGAPVSSNGTCTSSLFLWGDGNSVPLVCSGGAIQPNGIRSYRAGLFMSTYLTDNIGQLDETSVGSSEIVLPTIRDNAPGSYSTISTPFIVNTLLRLNDPVALAAYYQQPAPPYGPSSTPVSVPSSDPVTFAYAPLSSGTFVSLGNVNVPGGVMLPVLPRGWYQGRWSVADDRGDSFTSVEPFFVDGPATLPPVAPTCTASAKGGVTASITRHRHRRKHPRGRSGATLTLNCTTATATGQLAVWVQQGGAVLADGSATIAGGRAGIKLSAPLKKGTYKLVEVIDSGGQTAEADHVLTVR